MPIIPAKEIVRDAFLHGYAIPAINTQGGNYEIVRACIEAASEERSPLILQVYPDNTKYYGLDWIVYVVNKLSPSYNIPIAIHLDHGKSIDIVKQALDLGFSSVMLDFSERSLDENIQGVSQVNELARKIGASVEAEIGSVSRVGSSEESISHMQTANPEDVRIFLNNTSVDMLAVAIGNKHGHYQGPPRIQLDLLHEIRKVSGDTPLVLHGTTGIPPLVVQSCIQEGMAKINYGTLIREKAVDYTGKLLNEKKYLHYWKLLEDVKELLKKDIKNIITLVGSKNKL